MGPKLEKKISQLLKKSKKISWAHEIARALQDAQQTKTKGQEIETFETLVEVISCEMEGAFPSELLRRDAIVYSQETDKLLKEILTIFSSLHSKMPEPVAAYETCLFKIFSKVSYVGITKLSKNMCTVADLSKEMTELLRQIPFHPSQDNPEHRQQQLLRLCQDFATLTQSQAALEDDDTNEEIASPDGEIEESAGIDETALADAEPSGSRSTLAERPIREASPAAEVSRSKKKRKKSLDSSALSDITTETTHEGPSPETVLNEASSAADLPRPKKKRKKKKKGSSTLDDNAAGMLHETPEASVSGFHVQSSNDIGTLPTENTRKKRKERKSSSTSENEQPEREACLDKPVFRPAGKSSSLKGGQNEATGDSGNELLKKTKKRKKGDGRSSYPRVAIDVVPEADRDTPAEAEEELQNPATETVVDDEERQLHKKKKRKKNRTPPEDLTAVDGDNFDNLDASPRLTPVFGSAQHRTAEKERTKEKPEVNSGLDDSDTTVMPPFWRLEDDKPADWKESPATKATNLHAEEEVFDTSSPPNETQPAETNGLACASPSVVAVSSQLDLFAEASQPIPTSPVAPEIQIAPDNSPADDDNAESGYEEELNDLVQEENSMDAILVADDDDPAALSLSDLRAVGDAEDARLLVPGSPVKLDDGSGQVEMEKKSRGQPTASSSPRRTSDATSGTTAKSAELAPSENPAGSFAPKGVVEVKPDNQDQMTKESTDDSKEIQPILPEGQRTEPAPDSADPADGDVLAVDLEGSSPVPPDQVGQPASEPISTKKTRPESPVASSTQLDCKFILDCLVEQKEPVPSGSLLDEDVEFIEEIKTMTAGWVRDEASSEEEIDWDQIGLLPRSPVKSEPPVAPPIRRSERIAAKRGPEEIEPPQGVDKSSKESQSTPTISSAKITISTEPITFMERLLQYLPACWKHRLQEENPQTFCAPVPHDHLVHFPCVGGEQCHPFEHQHTVRMPCTCYGGGQTPYGADTPTSMPVSTTWAERDVVSASENEDETPCRYQNIINFNT